MDVTQYDPAMAAAVAKAVGQVQAATCLAPTSGFLICAALVVLAVVRLCDVFAPETGPRR